MSASDWAVVITIIFGIVVSAISIYQEMRKPNAANPMIAAALSAGEDTTGLCTVREAVATMLEYKSDTMEMCFCIAEKRVNVELKITKVEGQ